MYGSFVCALRNRKRRKSRAEQRSRRFRRAVLAAAFVADGLRERAPNVHRDRTVGEKLVYELDDATFQRYFRLQRPTFFVLLAQVSQEYDVFLLVL